VGCRFKNEKNFSDSNDKSRLFYILSKTFSVKWQFFEKNIRANDHFSKKSIRSNELSVKLPFGQMIIFRSNDHFSVISVIWLVFRVRFSVKRPFFKYFRSNDLLIISIFGQMTIFGKMNFRSNDLRLNGGRFGQMYFQSNGIRSNGVRSNGVSVKKFQWNDFSVKWSRAGLKSDIFFLF
jgi:hypothetical protein